MKKTLKWILVAAMAFITINVAQAQSQLERDLADLRTWMQKRSSQADSTISAEWPTVKKEFKELTYSLDSNTKKLSEKSRAEYSEYKQRYQEWEARHESELVNLDGRELERWEREMTGTIQISKIKPVHLRDAFVRALDYTREYRQNWSPDQWAYAEFVVGELNSRKQEVLDLLNTGDKIKIAALQVEFVTLKKSREAKDAYDDRKKERR
ncbi:hypothetical protein POKO110462_18955 [Pontibacter korlensis]|uniref:Uncharacterized protein n=1 Tax=Pontibacter korlensis TaxID=400092 RepID=A0A0E3UUW7_9BACT|nr:hypothetical protein [Pontibacter korlensis]AKD02037.1 hypothetical protein PKOR_01405 [Pontibacter korlensis]